jgi:hypothetical protein
MPSTLPPQVSWRCPKCAHANVDYVDADPVPYYCAKCDHAVMLKELTRLKAA